MDDSVNTIAEILKGNGYKTAAAVSAFHLNGGYSGFGQGFDDFFGVAPPSGHKKDKFIYLTRRANKTNQEAFEWLKKNSGDTFFLWMHYFDPHAPYSPPKPYSDMYYKGNPKDPKHRSMENVVYPNHAPETPGWLEHITDIEYVKAAYKGEVSYTDHEVGNLLNLIKDLGLEENTLIVLTSDHGESLGEHEMYFTHWALYEEVLHVPLIMKCPQLVPSGKRIKSLNMSIDIVPTILDLLDVNIERFSMDGESLIPAFEDRQPSFRRQRRVYAEHMNQAAVSVRDNKWAAIKDLKNHEYFSRYRYIKDRLQLYDRENDPFEFKDIAKSHPGITDRFDQELTAWLQDKRIKHPLKKHKVGEDVKDALRALGYAH